MFDVSVILTAYNVASYIERAVMSALAQEGLNLEVVVVDDASNDATAEVLAAIRDPRLKVIRLENNVGPGAARNIAMAAATGEWLAVLDGDDRFLPGRLRRLVARARAEGADIVVDDVMVEREVDGVCVPMFGRRLDSMPVLTAEGFIAGNSNVIYGRGLGYMKPIFSAKFLRAHGLSYPEEIRIGEDYVLLLEALLVGARAVVEPVAGYGYTVRQGSISHRLMEADVVRILAADEALQARRPYGVAAEKAQAVRVRNLREALDYYSLLEVLRRRDFAQVRQVMMRSPLVVRYLWLPVVARMRRLLR